MSEDRESLLINECAIIDLINQINERDGKIDALNDELAEVKELLILANEGNEQSLKKMKEVRAELVILETYPNSKSKS